jgi:hypothetical protein
MHEVIKKEKKQMTFKTISFSAYALCGILFASPTLFALWLPPLFFENQNNIQKNQKEEVVVAEADLGNTHFIIGAENKKSDYGAPEKTVAPHKEIQKIDGLPLNCDGHLCTVLFDKFYETLETLIAKEKRSISIAAYMLTDKRIVGWLKAAHARGVKI